MKLQLAYFAAPGTIARSAKRFICCSLLAHGFAWAGYPILPDQVINLTATADPATLTPGDFERASLFHVVNQPRPL